MIDFKNIDYLTIGNKRQMALYELIVNNKVFEILKKFTPVITGTIPIEIDTDESDVDVVCQWFEKKEFLVVLEQFSNFKAFELKSKMVKNMETIIARFEIGDFRFEIFAQNRPVDEQDSYRHMIVEHLILRQKGNLFRDEIIKLKKQGIKTEPAFGKLLGFKNNPYEELLNLETLIKSR